MSDNLIGWRVNRRDTPPGAQREGPLSGLVANAPFTPPSRAGILDAVNEPIRIAILLFDGVNAIDVAGPAEAFAAATQTRDQRPYEVVTWSIGARTVRSEAGLALIADTGLPEEPRADMLIIPGGTGIRSAETLTRVGQWVRARHGQFGRIASICTGAYALAESGLMRGRRIATHWAHAGELQRRYPDVEVDARALFLSDGRFFSSGGVTAGIDLTLELIGRDLGTDAAMRTARELVVYLRRPGSQEQFSRPLEMQTRAVDRLSEVCTWAAANLDGDLSVEALAARAGLSERQFSRRFRKAFGVPPAAYIKRVRLDAARKLLAQGVGMTRTAAAAGFVSVDGFRRAFHGAFGVTPGEYLQRFCQPDGEQ